MTTSLSALPACSAGTAKELPPADLARSLDAQVARTPTAVAVRDETTEYTYAQLHARANRFARDLQRHGVGPEHVVAVAVPRGVDLMVALLAVLKTGAAYLPIDPDHPAERVRFMLDDADVTAAVA